MRAINRTSDIRKQQMRLKAREIRQQRVAQGLATTRRRSPAQMFQLGEIPLATEIDGWDKLRVAVYAHAVADVLQDRAELQTLVDVCHAYALPYDSRRVLATARRRVMEAA
jgi:hypothetical protein